MVALGSDVWTVVASCAMAVCTALCSGLAGVLLARYIQARQHLAQFPGPTPRFLLGNLAMLIGEGGQAMPLFRLHHMLRTQYGSIVRFTMGSTPVLVISGASTTLFLPRLAFSDSRCRAPAQARVPV